MVGLLRQWQALESWAAAGKLGVLRALIRDDDQPLPGCFRYPHIASAESAVMVRDTKDRSGGTLSVPASTWRALVSTMR